MPVLSVLNLIIWFVLEGDRNWMGGMAFQPKELHVGRRVDFADSIKFVADQSSHVGRWLVRMIWLICWPVACENDLARGLAFVIHVSKIGCVNIPGTYSHYPYAFHVLIATSASSFFMFHPWTLPPTMPLGHCIELHPCSQDAFPLSRFTISVWPCCLARSKGVSPGNHSWHSNWPFPMYHFRGYAVRTAEFDKRDKWRFKHVETAVSICFTLHIGSRGCQKMSKDTDELWTKCSKSSEIPYQSKFKESQISNVQVIETCHI